MAVTARITHTVSMLGDVTGSISLGGTSYDVTAESGRQISVDIAANQTNKQVAIAFDKDTLKAIIIVATQDMLLETNSGSSADTSINLKANKPFVWDDQCGAPNPFSAADVTTCYVTNTTAGTIKAFIFEGDITP